MTDLVAEITCDGLINDQSENRNLRSFDDQEISFYPNPTHDTFMIACTGKISDIVVMDMTGRKIQNTIDRNSAQSEITVDLSQEESGIFIIQMKVDGTLISKKMVKL